MYFIIYFKTTHNAYGLCAFVLDLCIDNVCLGIVVFFQSKKDMH